jgi:hypothetical protein
MCLESGTALDKILHVPSQFVSLILGHFKPRSLGFLVGITLRSSIPANQLASLGVHIFVLEGGLTGCQNVALKFTLEPSCSTKGM